jgi:uncharacterized protein YbjT (DUF2867 family)
VTGATGKQGGAVARHLLAARVPIRALTRDLGSPSAIALAAAGAEVVRGDLTDPNSLDPVVQGVRGVFSVQDFYAPGGGPEGEVRQGKALADAAKRAGVAHFVQSTMADTPARTGVPHFDTKFAIEQYIDTIVLPRTFLGTVFFMDNVLDPKMGGSALFPTLAGSLRPDTPFHLVAVDDLGAIVATMFLDPQRYLGRKVNAMKEAYRRASGRHPKWYAYPAWLIRWLAPEFARQLRWHNDVNWHFSPDEARAIVPGMRTFEQFLRERRVMDL